MSNTSRVTPYQRIQNVVNAVGARAAAVCNGASAVAKWLAEETPEDRAAVQRFKAERRRDRLHQTGQRDIQPKRAELVNLTSASLHLREPESLIRSAEKLGYSVARPDIPVRDNSDILLTRDSGERLAIQRNPEGRLEIRTAGRDDRVQALVRQHTLDRTVEHLKSKGMSLQATALPNGEVQFLAREQDARLKGGAAEIRAQVHSDGTIHIDIDKVKGNRCQDIVKELASAMGGEVSDMKRKASCFQLPGELARTKVKI